MNEDLLGKSISELTTEEKNFLYKRLLELFLNWNGSENASETEDRFETQQAVFYFLNRLDKE